MGGEKGVLGWGSGVADDEGGDAAGVDAEVAC